MLKYIDTAVVFQELPDEVTLAVNLSGCPCRCPGCHSKHLWGDGGQPLDDEAIEHLLDTCHQHISCISLMGGDSAPAEVDRLVAGIRQRHPRLKTAWWSGRSLLSPLVNINNFDYVKLGPYLAHLGPLNSPSTNQRLYRVERGTLVDITQRLRKKGPKGLLNQADCHNVDAKTTAVDRL